jgi:hypothetical protein
MARSTLESRQPPSVTREEERGKIDTKISYRKIIIRSLYTRH